MLCSDSKEMTDTLRIAIQYPLAAAVRHDQGITRRPLLDECSTCALHGLPCMGCAEATKGKMGPGKINNQRTLYKFEDENEAFVYNYAESSIDGSGFVDSEFLKNSKKWAEDHPEETIVFIKV